MSLRRRLLAYGVLGVIAAGIGFAWAWAIERRIHDDVVGRPRPYPKDWGEG